MVGRDRPIFSSLRLSYLSLSEFRSAQRWVDGQDLQPPEPWILCISLIRASSVIFGGLRFAPGRSPEMRSLFLRETIGWQKANFGRLASLCSRKYFFPTGADESVVSTREYWDCPHGTFTMCSVLVLEAQTLQFLREAESLLLGS